MQFATYIGAVLLAVLALALPALAIQFKHGKSALSFMRPRGRFLWDLVASELGVTVTYFSKFGNVNTTTPPTAIEANFLPCQVAQVFFADTDTEAIVIHNWGGLLGPSFATFLFPIVIMDKVLGAAATSFATNFTFGLGNSNQVYIEKPIGTGTGGTYNVYLLLPHSLIARGH
jgi:hypothetical protein